MCDTAMNYVSECLVPLAREHLVPPFRDRLLPLVRDRMLPLLWETADMIMGVPKDVAAMKDELERIEDDIQNIMAEAEEDNTLNGIKTRAKQLREVAFGIEDVIDEYMICEGRQPRDPGCAALPREAADFVKSIILRLQIAYMIPSIKSRLCGINEGSGGGDLQIQPSIVELGPSSLIANRNTVLENRQQSHFYLQEDQVVGFENPEGELIRLLTGESADLTVISVVGIGGQGKSTLAKKVFCNKEVTEHFDCQAWIPVSRSYDVDVLLRKILQELCKERIEDLPDDISTMDRQSLINKVREYLREKRYVIFFDDVWNTYFWDEFEHALIDDKKRSRIFITTRNMQVARISSEVHELQPLTPENSLELFYKKAFHSNGDCPEFLKNISSKIVKKCEGLPLAIANIGRLLSRRDRSVSQWQRFSQNLSAEWADDPYLTSVTKILGFSYHDLPYHLKRCFLYFGIYPENYNVKAERLIRQWIAEGFVKQEPEKTLEEVAEEYLIELIHRGLVQVSSFSSDGKTISCRVRYPVRQMILDKIKDLSFCHFTSENEDQSIVFTGKIRRLTVATSSNNLMESVESSNMRSLRIFRNEELPDSSLTGIPSKYRLLKVLDFEDFPLYHNVPQNLGDLFHLRYLSFRNTRVANLPGSIGMLHNLETLDVRQTMVREMPREISKLKKLRHLLAYDKSKDDGFGIQMKDGIGDIASLQTLREVEADHGGVELVTELERLTQLRMLGLTRVKQEYTSALCSSINKMQHLEKLYIAAINEHEVLDLQFDVSTLKKLCLIGKLANFPDWVGVLENLVKLSLSHSMLALDPLTSLKDLPNLSYLSLQGAYEGGCLNFPDGGFRILKQLVLRRLYNLNSILIGGEALCSLEKFELGTIPKLGEVPSGVYSLPKLKDIYYIDMSIEFEQSINIPRGQTWTKKDV